MFYLGIDQHARQLTICLRDEGGKAVLRRQVSTEPKRVREFLHQLENQCIEAGGYVAVVEVCGFNDWLLKLLPEYGCKEVVLVQPEDRDRRKTDRRDAHRLSELLWINRERLLASQHVQGLRRVFIPSADDQHDRQLTQLRKRLGASRTRLINRVKHALVKHNLQHGCPTKGIRTQAARAWLKKLTLPAIEGGSGRKGRRAAQSRPAFGLGHWVGARVGSPYRCPTLRPVQFHFNDAFGAERGDHAKKIRQGGLTPHTL
jgi:transposase